MCRYSAYYKRYCVLELPAACANREPEPPDFTMLLEFQNVLKTALPDVTVLLSEEKMDLTIKAPGNVYIHLMFTWTGAEDIMSRESK